VEYTTVAYKNKKQSAGFVCAQAAAAGLTLHRRLQRSASQPHAGDYDLRPPVLICICGRGGAHVEYTRVYPHGLRPPVRIYIWEGGGGVHVENTRVNNPRGLRPPVLICICGRGGVRNTPSLGLRVQVRVRVRVNP